MTATPHRRVLRPDTRPAIDPRYERVQQRRLDQLARERESQARWMAKLKRAFHAVECLQSKIARLERALLPSRD